MGTATLLAVLLFLAFAAFGKNKKIFGARLQSASIQSGFAVTPQIRKLNFFATLNSVPSNGNECFPRFNNRAALENPFQH